MKYRQKLLEVEAFRFGFDGLPPWFTEIVERKEASAYRPTAYDHVAILTIGGEKRTIQHGDMVFRDEFGRVRVWRYGDFLQAYEVVED